MKKYEVKIGEALGDIKLRMDRQEVRNILGEYKEYRGKAFGTDKLYEQDIFNNFVIGYDNDNRVNFICFTNFKENTVIFDEIDVRELGSYELFYTIYKMDQNLDMELCGYTSNKLGIGITYEKEIILDNLETEKVHESLESFVIASKNYWSNN